MHRALSCDQKIDLWIEGAQIVGIRSQHGPSSFMCDDHDMAVGGIALLAHAEQQADESTCHTIERNDLHLRQ